MFFDRVDHHLARKLVDRNTDEYHSTLSSSRYNTKKVLASLQTHQYKIHSGSALLACIKNINKTSKRPSEPSLQEESLQDEPHTSNNQRPGPSHKTFRQRGPSQTRDIEQPGTSNQRELWGKYVVPKAARKTLLKFKKEIPTSLRKQYNIRDRNTFQYYYDEAIKATHDFKNYKQESTTNPVQTSKQRNDNAQTMANNVKQIWREVDVNMGVFPRNFLNNSDLIEDNFSRPHLNVLTANMNLPKEKKTVHIQASTIKSKLCSLAVFARFLINRRIFINIRYNSLTRIINKVQELNSSLKRYIDQRELVMSKHKSDTLIAANKFQSYGSSKHIKELNADLHSLTTSPKSVKLSKQKAIDVRDYLMVSLYLL